MPVFRLRPQAEHDQIDLWLSVAEHADAADRISDRLAEMFRLLAEHPQAGPARGLRMFPAGEYLIFYCPLEDGIDIIRVLHAARDIPSLF
jgi:toxin ParE1/3/4